MADGYWRYADARQPPMPQQAAPPAVKRSRSDYDVPVGHELSGYFSREEERVGHRDARDTESLGASYERYLRGQMSSYGAGEPTRPLSGGLSGHHPIDDPRMMGVGGIDPGMGGKGRNMGFGGGRSEMPLPPDASNTLFVEGLPSNCTRREVSHIFRPFVGFREVRLVNKESRHGGEPLVLCFVDFTTPAHAAVALDALQGSFIYFQIVSELTKEQPPSTWASVLCRVGICHIFHVLTNLRPLEYGELRRIVPSCSEESIGSFCCGLFDMMNPKEALLPGEFGGPLVPVVVGPHKTGKDLLMLLSFLMHHQRFLNILFF